MLVRERGKRREEKTGEEGWVEVLDKEGIWLVMRWWWVMGMCYEMGEYVYESIYV